MLHTLARLPTAARHSGARRLPAGHRFASAVALDTPKAWGGSLDPSKVHLSYPTEVVGELQAYAKELSVSGDVVDDFVVDLGRVSATTEFLVGMEKETLVEGPGFAILPPLPALSSVHELRTATYILTEALGNSVIQNAEGDKSVLVYDRDASRKMADGQRYHQSHEGGSLHTDNVNVPDTWEYMFLTCLQPAFVGGENILVSVTSLHNRLLEVAPDALEILASDFYWEFRGFDRSAYYKAPILFYNKFGDPCFRYLRDYMESAHNRLNKPLSRDQLWALDSLVALCELSDLQYRFTATRGETLVCNDMHIMHGRTMFIDAAPATLQYDLSNPVNRLMQRNWLQTRTAEYLGMNQSAYEVLP